VNYSEAPLDFPEGEKFSVKSPGALDTVRWHTGQSGAPDQGCLRLTLALFVEPNSWSFYWLSVNLWHLYNLYTRTKLVSPIICVGQFNHQNQLGNRCKPNSLLAVSAVPATLPRPSGSVPRPPGGRLGASAATRRTRAAQAHASLGRVVRHRQGSEARDIQAGKQSRRGLQQRLEHPTAMSLLPLRCFQVVHTPRSHTKSNHQGRVSLASAKPDPPSRARRGNPLSSKFSSRKVFHQKGFRVSRLYR
jgi:hypothetical protein